jgi:hypothetical protein
MSGLHYLQMSKQNEQKEREKNAYSQTSRLETPEELQLHHNPKKNPVFDCAVALCTMQNALLVISNLTCLT